jgi:hypothetical protein
MIKKFVKVYFSSYILVHSRLDYLFTMNAKEEISSYSQLSEPNANELSAVANLKVL